MAQKFLYLLLLSVIVTVITGCDRFAQEHQAPRYTVVPFGGDSAVLTDQKTGDTWRLTASGWSPISKLSPPTSLIAQLRVERDRRKSVYAFLSKSTDANRIAQQLKTGSISQEQARDLLQKLLPKELGSLPPEAENGRWELTDDQQKP